MQCPNHSFHHRPPTSHLSSSRSINPSPSHHHVNHRVQSYPYRTSNDDLGRDKLPKSTRSSEVPFIFALTPTRSDSRLWTLWSEDGRLAISVDYILHPCLPSRLRSTYDQYNGTSVALLVDEQRYVHRRYITTLTDGRAVYFPRNRTTCISGVSSELQSPKLPPQGRELRTLGGMEQHTYVKARHRALRKAVQTPTFLPPSHPTKRW